ncbi:hypothetical protein LEP1GSC186_3869 [Leptospira noguchii serovar Autumnalis str. ZUN142]|uniref:Uncharacterized protein n=1 Tax=Leptospira noguchii serovar Autumnalis str. ZUN142 TaxID=1085540 RepID=M6UBC2_9LEPT|nr:hypothetical protein LEP1GSC186_3869 [Leptospira noguchii serovar Autumnalis str. ZUN142]
MGTLTNLYFNLGSCGNPRFIFLKKIGIRTCRFFSKMRELQQIKILQINS